MARNNALIRAYLKGKAGQVKDIVDKTEPTPKLSEFENSVVRLEHRQAVGKVKDAVSRAPKIKPREQEGPVYSEQARISAAVRRARAAERKKREANKPTSGSFIDKGE